MLNPTQVVIEAFVRELQAMYERIYGVLDPAYPRVIAFIGRAAMENIANSDAPYHNAEHTIIPSHDLVVVRLGHYKGDVAGAAGFQKSLQLLMQAVPRQN
jgi:hypothetical protein